jgi:hypothetical protein
VSDLVSTPACADDERRADLIAPPPSGPPPFVDLNGIDFLEVDGADHRILRVTFLKPVPASLYGVTADGVGVTITGGTRIVGIKPTAAALETPTRLRIEVDVPGDFSPYVLALPAHPDIDPVRRSAVFSFMATCPTDVDCRPVVACPPPELVEPLLDYLAKDYASFRRLLIDLLPTLNPDWTERNPSDLGMALLELLAYEGDRLSYFQDAVANEAYLDTLRARISARRHARLVDYQMHDGRNAWAPVHIQVDATAPVQLARGTPLFTKVLAPLPGQTMPPAVVIPAGAITVDALARNPDLASVAAFETAHTVTLLRDNNEIRLHAWGEEECCLPVGTTEAYLYSVPEGLTTAREPMLQVGDYLVLEEVLGPRTGAAPDADPAHRQLVRIETVADLTDPLYERTLVADVLQIRRTGHPALPLMRVTWRREDALRFPLCLSSRLPGGALVRNVSVARGNIVLADHGLTCDETFAPEALTVDGRLQLDRAPLTMEARPEKVSYGGDGRLLTDRTQLDADVRAVRPAVALLVTTPVEVEPWEAEPELLESSPADRHFVAEVDDDGRAILRFGDGEYGAELSDVVSLRAVYRVGNGREGNVGAEAIAHAAPVLPAGWIQRIRNPLAAEAGADPETIDEVRQLAPQAFHSELFRAVTEEDWAEAARRLPDVQGAVATYRWTGSWYTVFVAVDPRDRADLVDLPNGRTRLEPAFEQRVRGFLTRFRLAGYDVELRPPRFVPLDVEIEVCAAPGHFRTDVVNAVRVALSAQVLPDGTRGFFHPENFTFGEPLYLSRLYAAVERVEGVDSAVVRRFQRYGQTASGELEKGVLPIAPWEIVRLDNDPSFVEHGVLSVIGKGGKG